MFKSQLYTTKRNQVKADCWWLLECGWWVSGSITGVLHCCSVCTNYSTWLPTPASAQTHYGETKYYPLPRHYLTSYRVTAYSDTVKGGPISYYELIKKCNPIPFNDLRKDPYHNLGKGNPIDPILYLWKGEPTFFIHLKGYLQTIV